MELFNKALITLITVLGGTGICYLANVALKWHISNLITKTKNLSKDKATLLTKLLNK